MPSLARTLLCLTLLFLAGCNTVPTAVDDRLYFGRAIPSGGEITETQWNAFVAEVVVPRCPDGFTVWSSTGHWKGDDGSAVSEQSCVLEIVHGNDAAAEAKILEIAQAYRERFKQEAVLRIRTPASMSLVRK